MEQLKRRVFYHIAGYVVSLMYSYGIAVSLALSLSLEFSPFDVFKYTALILFILTVLFHNKWTSLASFIGMGIYAYWAIRNAGALEWFFENVPPFLTDVWSFVNGKAPLTESYHFPLGLAVIAIIVLFSRISASRLRGTSSLIVFSATIFVLEWSFGHRYILAVALCAAAIASVYAYSFARRLFLRDMSDAEEDYTEEDELFDEGETVRTNHKTIRIPNATAIAAFAIPLALIASFVATMSLPADASRLRSKLVEVAVDDIVDYVGQYTGLSRKLYSFSISSYGYTSSYELGGPVNPSKHQALVVEGVSPSLLKGSTKSYYTGRGWTNTGNLGSFRFNSALWTGKRVDVFDLERPDTETRGDLGLLYRNIRLRITPYQNLYTIFSPTRPYSVTSGNKSFIPYFNNIGELYPKRKIVYGSSYTVQARQINNLNDRLVDYIVELEESLPPEDEEKMEGLRKRYLQLPDDLPSRVKRLASELADSAKSDSLFLRAMSIRDYLMENFRYTLSPRPVPEGRDFVDYFLETGEGYCTYYASAMTILARAAGIPARYAEGFLLTNMEHEENVYNVTGENAHAWAELYFEGIGWIPFDPTPIGQPRTISAPPSPRPPASDVPPAPSPSLSPEPEVPITEAKKETPLWLILTLVGCALILFNVLLIVFHKVNYGKKRLLKEHGTRGAAEIWWRSILDMLPYQDKFFARRSGETATMLAKRIGRLIQCDVCTFEQLVRIIMRAYYSPKELSEVETDVVYRYFRAMENRMIKTMTPPAFAFVRILFPRAFGFRGKKRKI